MLSVWLAHFYSESDLPVAAQSTFMPQNLNSMNAQEDNKESANRFTLKKTEIPDFTSLNINLEDSDLNIEESPNEKSYIEYAQATKDKKNPVSYS